MGSDPFVALGAVLILGAIVRWVFKPSRPRSGRPIDAAASPDLGMLRVVASALARQQAMELRATLGDAGIRSSMSARRDALQDVLVFADDEERARAVLSR